MPDKNQTIKKNGSNKAKSLSLDYKSQIEAILNAFNGFIYVCSDKYLIEFMNHHLIKRTGYNGTGKRCYQVLHNRKSICPWCVNDRIFKGESVQWEVKSPKDNRWFAVSNTPLYHPDGRISKQSIFTDITEQKTFEEKLKKEKEKAEQLLNIAKVMIIALNQKGEITLINNKACEILEYKRDEVLGKYWFDNFLPLKEIKKTSAYFKKMMNDLVDNKAHYENTILTKTKKERIIAWFNTILKDENGKIIGSLSSGEDITHRKMAENKIKQQQKMLKNSAINLKRFSRKLLAIREQENKNLALNIHDELGAMAIEISSHLSIIKEEIKDNKLENALKRISSAEKTLSKSIALIKTIAVDLRPPDLDILGLAATLKKYFLNLSKKTGLKIDFKEKLAKTIDNNTAIVLYRISQEALNNIIKHAQATKVSVQLKTHGTKILFQIKDNGKGFKLKNLLNTAQYVKIGIQGMKERVESLDGDFKIKSNPRQGTIINIVLPVK